MKRLNIIIAMVMVLAILSCRENDNMVPATKYASLLIYNGATGFLGVEDSAKAYVFLDTTNSPKDYPGIKLNYNYVYPGPFTGIPSVVQYMAVRPGQNRVRFALPNGLKISDNIFELSDHSYQTVYLSDSLSYFNVLMTRDTLIRLEGKARVRLVNLSPDAGKVQIYLDTMVVKGLKSIGYKSISPFVSVSPYAYIAVRVRSLSDETAGTMIRKSIPIIAGRSYTLILRGYVHPPDKDPNKSINLSALINQ